MNAILLVDFGSTFTKVTAVDLANECIMATSKSHTTIETDITLGLNQAVQSLEAKIGHITYQAKLGCSSAAGGLKMVAVGLVPELTVKAARTAALSAGAKVLNTYSYKLNTEELMALEASKPDIVLLSGGTDGGNEEVVLHNANLLAKGCGTYPVIYAGNKSVVDQVKEIFDTGGRELMVTGNVMPSMEAMVTGPVKDLIGQVFISRIIEAKGLKKAEDYLDNLLMPTPTAVMKATELLAKGTEVTQGFGDLMVVDMGGATTDIHSACQGEPSQINTVLKGLKEPYLQRSVEGDLGARYSLRALVETVGPQNMANELNWTLKDLEGLIGEIEARPDCLPDVGSALGILDHVSAKVAVAESVRRHSGQVTSHYTPFGQVLEQVGKDLTGVKRIIGTGGPIIYNSHPADLLSHALYDEQEGSSLRPKAPSYYLDKNYIMAAMGILASDYPETALKIMKKEIVAI